MRIPIAILLSIFVASMLYRDVGGEFEHKNSRIKILFDENFPRIVAYINGSQEMILSYNKIFVLNSLNELGLFFSDLRKEIWKFSKINTPNGFIIEYVADIDIRCIMSHHHSIIKNWGSIRIVFRVENTIFERDGKKIDGSRSVVIDIEIVPLIKEIKMNKIVLLNEFWAGSHEYSFLYNGKKIRLQKGELIKFESTSDYILLEHFSARVSYGWNTKFIKDNENSQLELYYSFEYYPKILFVYDYSKVYHDAEVIFPTPLFDPSKYNSKSLENIAMYAQYFVIGMGIGSIMLLSGKLIINKKH